MTEPHKTENEARVGDLTVRFTNGRAEVVERRRQVGRDVLACGYVCGVVDTDEDGACWSYDHGGPRCPVIRPGQEASNG